MNAPAGTVKTWTVKGKPVDYVRDAKTSTVPYAAMEGYVIANPDTAQWHIDFQFAYDGSTAVNAEGVGTVGKGTVGDMNTASIHFGGGYVNSTDDAWSCSDGTPDTPFVPSPASARSTPPRRPTGTATCSAGA